MEVLARLRLKRSQWGDCDEREGISILLLMQWSTAYTHAIRAHDNPPKVPRSKKNVITLVGVRQQVEREQLRMSNQKRNKTDKNRGI